MTQYYNTNCLICKIPQTASVEHVICDACEKKCADLNTDFLPAYIAALQADVLRLLSIIKDAPLPFDRSDSELAQEYKNWFFRARSQLKASETSTTLARRTSSASL